MWGWAAGRYEIITVLGHQNGELLPRGPMWQIWSAWSVEASGNSLVQVIRSSLRMGGGGSEDGIEGGHGQLEGSYAGREWIRIRQAALTWIGCRGNCSTRLNSSWASLNLPPIRLRAVGSVMRCAVQASCCASRCGARGWQS